MDIAGTETVEFQICDACAKIHVDNKHCMMIIKNGLNVTTIDDQDESLFHLSQVRDCGLIVEEEAHAYGRNQSTCASQTNAPT